MARQLIGKVKPVNASGMAAEVPDQKQSKADNVVRRLRLSTATIPEPNGLSEAASQLNYADWSTWAMPSSYFMEK